MCGGGGVKPFKYYDINSPWINPLPEIVHHVAVIEWTHLPINSSLM